MAPAGAGMPTKKFAGPGRPVRIVDHDVEAGEPQAGADREHHGGDPADVAELVQPPEIEDQRRRDAEIEEIGEAVELGAEARRALEHARDAPVDAVEQRGEHDRVERPFELALDRQPDPGQAGAEREQRDQVRQQRAERDLPEAPALGRRRSGSKGENGMAQYSAAFAAAPWPERSTMA